MPDAYDSFQAPSAGQAAIMDYRVQDAHAHAWQLYDTVKLAGPRAAPRGPGELADAPGRRPDQQLGPGRRQPRSRPGLRHLTGSR